MDIYRKVVLSAAMKQRYIFIAIAAISAFNHCVQSVPSGDGADDGAYLASAYDFVEFIWCSSLSFTSQNAHPDA